MQLIQNGPDIPNALIHAHEEGRVVFFCGSGISAPAGLPNFETLVDKIYDGLYEQPNEGEKKSCQRGLYDLTLKLLESRLQGGREEIYKQVTNILTPQQIENATKTHESLLQLGRCRNNRLRLVTTNFDLCFDEARNELKEEFNTYTPTAIPIPKPDRWDGLVHLHGRLPQNNQSSYSQDNLVLTSGDFGLAYLVERWASRFISELFRNYTVCFVGYSLNDTILRYMMDALSFDRQGSNSHLQKAYAFGGYKQGEREKVKNEWGDKGVVPILYDEKNKHENLHTTLEKWADTYRNGIAGKTYFVSQHANSFPLESAQEDDFVGRMLWALSDKSGFPAKTFAEYKPTPCFEWLDKFSDNTKYTQDDLEQFGVTPHRGDKKALNFALTDRPTSYHHAPGMSLVSRASSGAEWDNMMKQIAHWLLLHLNDPRLVLWIVKQGGHLHNRFIQMLTEKLNELSQKSCDKLEKLRQNSPSAIPNKEMRVLWSWFITGCIKTHHDPPFNIFDGEPFFRHDGLTTALRLQLRELLAPKIIFREPTYPYALTEDEYAQTEDEWKRIKKVIQWEVMPAGRNVRHCISQLLEKESSWQEALPALFDDFHQLLRNTFELMDEGHTDTNYSNNLYIPSISPHSQNKDNDDSWKILVYLARDAWDRIYERDRPRAIKIAEDWFESPYIIFKRLALYAASHDGVITPSQWVSWLLNDKHWDEQCPLLWLKYARRETMRLFVLQGHNLQGENQQKLESAILESSLYFQQCSDTQKRDIWLYLAKLESSGLKLLPQSQKKLNELAQHGWEFKDNEKEEFSIWSEVSNKPIPSDDSISIAPTKRRELVIWLKEQKEPKTLDVSLFFSEDQWAIRCQDNFSVTFLALCDLAKKDIWPKGRWYVALHRWASEEKNLATQSWRYAAPLIQNMPDDTFKYAVHAVASWVKAASKKPKKHQDILVEICRRVLDLGAPLDKERPSNDPTTQAINHPAGLVTEALLALWFERDKPHKDDKLPRDLKDIFTKICEPKDDFFRHGKVLLALHTISLFHADPDWTKEHLLPLFDWENNQKEDAKAAWEGFLWASRIETALFVEIKKHFLDTASHYSKLNERFGQERYSVILTYTALNAIEGYKLEEFKSVIKQLPPKGLTEITNTLSTALGSIDTDKRTNYWKEHIKPFWEQAWPKEKQNLNEENRQYIARNLAELCISTQESFPDAFNTLKNWLHPIPRPNYLIQLLNKSNLCSDFPEETLGFLYKIIDKTSPPSSSAKRHECLEAIVTSRPELKEDHRYQELRTSFC